MHNIKLLHKKLICIFLMMIFICIVPLHSNATETNLNIYAPACILMESSTGKILYSKNANAKMYPASTTKVMTAILTLEKCNLNDIVTVSHDAVFNVPSTYSHASLREGEQLTVEQLLYVLLIPSANDAAFALAEHIGGSVENFATMMNEKAVELGCKNTHFVNPNGIHDENHYSTAYDLALMGQYAMKNAIFRKIVSTTTYTLPITNKYDKEDRIFATTNELLKSPSSSTYYKYATGAKTGYTDAAKNCIIATASKDSTDLIVVILHDEKTDEGLNTRAADCKTLFEYGFNNFSLRTISTSDSIEQTITVSGATEETKKLDLITTEDISAYLPNDFDTSSIEKNITLNTDITAPITKGSIVGQITYTANGETFTADLVASHDVYQFDIIKIILEILLILVVLALISLFMKRSNNNKSKYSSNSKNYKKTSASKRSKNKSSKRMYYDFDFYPSTSNFKA
jgi:serine-type D-Ala-D-Ala carboxypeptidase (penicillin-binding protein 5/6)